MKKTELKQIIKEILEDDQSLISEIEKIIKNEVYLRTIRYTDDYEVDPNSITNAAKLIVNMLKSRELI